MRFARAVLLLAVLSFGALLLPSVAGAVPNYVVTVEVNGKPIKGEWSTQPYINDVGRTMISVRSLTDALQPRGCSVDWDQDALSVIVQCNGRIVRYQYYWDSQEERLLGRPYAYVQQNGQMERYDLLTAPEINRDRSFLGLRDIGNLLGANVDWRPGDEDRLPAAVIWFRSDG